MLRVVRRHEEVVVDGRQRMPGRGAYVHRDARCMELAVKRGGLARTLKGQVGASILEVLRSEGL